MLTVLRTRVGLRGLRLPLYSGDSTFRVLAVRVAGLFMGVYSILRCCTWLIIALLCTQLAIFLPAQNPQRDYQMRQALIVPMLRC